MWSVDEIVGAVDGTVLRRGKEAFSGISTDSRTIGEGELFIPLKGPNFDGHLYIGSALERSRGGTLCEDGRSDLTALLANSEGTVILVRDTLDALLDLARYRRRQTDATFIAITGSNGKTTTKEILAGMMERSFAIHFNEKNYNNLVGVSKSILSIKGKPEFCIFELGTSSKGEILRLAGITEPEISLVTNVNPSHLEGLGDMEGIAEEKLSLFSSTKEGGTVLINADDPYIKGRYKDRGHRVVTFGMTATDVDLGLLVDQDLGWGGFHITFNFHGARFEARTKLLGRHNLGNILASASIAHVAGLSAQHIVEGVEAFDSYNMRFKPIRTKEGYIVVDDSYNANPSSTEWAVRTLLDLPCRGRRIVVLGDMKELGDRTPFYHRELGKFLKGSGIDRVLLFGEYVRETFLEIGDGKALMFDSRTHLIDYLRDDAEEGDVVLVKGSRAARMNEVVEALIS